MQLNPDLLQWENWRPNEVEKAQFEQVYQILLTENSHTNLTRITAPDEFVEKHLWDSFAGFFYLTNNLDYANKNVIDIGTGAGFPGIPLAIIQPHTHFTLLEATQKKINFVNLLIEKLALKNAVAIQGRAEEIGQNGQHREQYDLTLMRALASPTVCVEYALPLLNLGGIAILYQGRWEEEDTVKLTQVLPQLGGELFKVESFQTPLTHSERHCIYVKKIKKTPNQFPRPVGIPKKKPLG